MGKMNRVFLLVAVILLIAVGLKGEKTFVISGTVTYFKGRPIEGATIRFNNRAFENLYETLSDQKGHYSMAVKEGDYYCLYAIKESEYRVSRLEYWAWNVPVHLDMKIDPRYDRMEIYGVNAFEPQVTPQETYMVYFRPMSLGKSLALVAGRKVGEKEFQGAARAERLLNEKGKLIDVAPDAITAEELVMEINGARAEILGIQKTREFARGFFFHGYLVQIMKPKNGARSIPGYDRISITLHSKETGESGMGEAFVYALGTEL